MGSFDEFAVGVVFYNPTEEEVFRVKNYLAIAPRIYIYDNTAEKNRLLYLSKLDLENCTYIFQNRNDGIAVALNALCQSAKQDGFQYLLLLDQDSIFKVGNIERLFHEVKVHAVGDIGVYAPEIRYIKSNNVLSTEILNRSIPSEMSEIPWAITSGSVISLESFIQSKGFDENLFIDKVDYDYCVQLRKQGYKTVRITGTMLYQFLGETQGGYFKFSGHNPIRHYYLFRNRLYLVQKYKENYKGTRKFAFLSLSIIRHLCLVLFFESSKIEKFKAMINAYRDYKKGKMGKYEPIN